MATDTDACSICTCSSEAVAPGLASTTGERRAKQRQIAPDEVQRGRGGEERRAGPVHAAAGQVHGKRLGLPVQFAQADVRAVHPDPCVRALRSGPGVAAPARSIRAGAGARASSAVGARREGRVVHPPGDAPSRRRQRPPGVGVRLSRLPVEIPVGKRPVRRPVAESSSDHFSRHSGDPLVIPAKSGIHSRAGRPTLQSDDSAHP